MAPDFNRTPELRYEAFEHFTLVIDNAPEIVLHPVDLHENVVEVAALMKERTHRLNAAPPDPEREDRPTRNVSTFLRRAVDKQAHRTEFTVP
jgi:hypothetical protein